MPEVTPDQYRHLLGRLPTGVTVTTALDAGGRPVGMTASSVTSVSLAPPLVVVCVQEAATIHSTMHDAPLFALNVLAADQASLSHQFAGPVERRFEGVRYRAGFQGLPLLEGVVAHIVCEAAGHQQVGDHTMFFGRVVGGETFSGRPLVRFESRYTTTDTP